MKGRSAEYGGQNTGTEVSGIGHESVTVMDSPTPVELRGVPAKRQRAQAEARAPSRGSARAPSRARLFETGRPPLALSPLVEPVRGGDRQHRRRRRGRRFLSREPRARRRAEVEATTPSAERIYRSDGAAAAHRNPAVARARRAALLAAAGDAPVRRRARSSAGSRSRCRATPASSSSRAWSSAGWRWAKAGSTPACANSWRVRATAGSCSPTRRGSTDAGAALDRRAVGAGARALATMVAAAPKIEARLPELRAALGADERGVEAGASVFDGLLVARLLSASPGRLRVAVIAAIVALGARKPRLWP